MKIFSTAVLCAFFALRVLSQSVSVSPVSIDFGALDYGQKDSVAITLTNLLDEPIALEEMVFFDFYESSPFYITNFPGSISVGNSAEVYVVFEPIHNMDHNSELVIRTSGNRGAAALDIRGEGHYAMDYYDDTYNLIDEPLKLALKTILASGYQQSSYNQARDEMFMVIDNQAVNGQGASENTVTCVYTGVDAVGYVNRDDVQGSPFNFNTEHIFPQGFFNQNLPMRSDVHHLAPTETYANSERGSLRFGEVIDGTAVGAGGSFVGTDAEGAQVFEPRDEQKGPSARALMYFVVRYQNYSSHMSFQLEGICRAWHEAYPPSEIDIARNEAIFSFQNNRNPFIDYPQFIDRIFALRFEQNRPNVGELFVSHQSIDFGAVTDVAEPVAFNLVLTNHGERFISLSNIGIQSGGGAFTLADGQPQSATLSVGERVEIPVFFDPNAGDGDFSAQLLFNTNLSSNQEVIVPISASTLVATDDAAVAAYRLYPNPFSDAVNFSDGQEFQGERTIKVYDISGRLCKVITTRDGRSLPVQDLRMGFYHFVVEDATGHFTSFKMVKQ